jgi:hypothetical protein
MSYSTPHVPAAAGSARTRRPHQRIRAGRVDAQVNTGGAVLAPYRILREYEIHHNQHRPHRSLHSAAPLKPLPQPVILGRYRVRKQTRTGGMINEYRLVA